MSEAVVGEGTVRRPAGYWTPAVQALLRHYESVGFEGAPRALAVEDGWEVLSYLEGEADVAISDEGAYETGRLLRRTHDAQVGFRAPDGAVWQVPPGAIPGSEVVCHNDALGPNTVFRDGCAVALIDWELAAPGLRLTDLSHAAAWWAPLRSDNALVGQGLPLDSRGTRIRLLADGYGLDRDERSELLRLLPIAIDGMYETQRVWGEVERRPRWSEMWESGSGRGLRSIRTTFDAKRDEIAKALA